MNLDINTVKGQESLAYEQEMLTLIKNSYPNRIKQIIQTPKNKDAKYDGLFVNHHNEILAIFETKCRNLTLSQFISFKTWLITHDKLVCGSEMSKLSKVPFVGLLYLIPDKTCLMWKITDDKGEFLLSLNAQYTVTQKTINGGEIKRYNAYLSYEEAKANNLLTIIK